MQQEQNPYLFSFTDPEDQKREKALVSEMESVQRTMNNCRMEMQKLQERHKELMDEAITRGTVKVVHAPKPSNLVTGIN